MGNHRTRAPVTRRFLSSLVVAATLSALAAHGIGEDVTVWLERIPASDKGWAVIGWLFGGPPLVLAALAWNDRRRFDAAQRRQRATLYAAWFGLGGFVVPALAGNSVEIFGEGVGIGNPLAFGWTCGAVANIAAIAFALGITRMSAQAGEHGHRLGLTFIESGWILLVAASLLFAAYGRELGFVY